MAHVSGLPTGVRMTTLVRRSMHVFLTTSPGLAFALAIISWSCSANTCGSATDLHLIQDRHARRGHQLDGDDRVSLPLPDEAIALYRRYRWRTEGRPVALHDQRAIDV